jgi:hypothetical protein
MPNAARCSAWLGDSALILRFHADWLFPRCTYHVGQFIKIVDVDPSTIFMLEVEDFCRAEIWLWPRGAQSDLPVYIYEPLKPSSAFRVSCSDSVRCERK